MEHNSEKYAVAFDKSEISKCVGCHLCRLVCSCKAIKTARKVVQK